MEKAANAILTAAGSRDASHSTTEGKIVALAKTISLELKAMQKHHDQNNKKEMVRDSDTSDMLNLLLRIDLIIKEYFYSCYSYSTTSA